MKKTFLGAATVAGLCMAVPAANAQVAPEPEPVEYVRVCDAFGKGAFYIPGTDTCMRIGGYIYSDARGGRQVGARRLSELKGHHWRTQTRAELYFEMLKETEIGLMRTKIELRRQFDNGHDTWTRPLRFAYIELGGVRIGVDEGSFNSFFGYYGDFIHDNTVLGGGYRNNVLQYRYAFDNGLTALLSLEQGADEETDFNGQIKSYAPHTVIGLKYEQPWGAFTGAVAYDAVNSAFVGKAKISLNVTDRLNVWLMGGYKDMRDEYYLDPRLRSTRIRDNTKGVRAVDSFYGTWGGHFVGWLGGTYKFTPKATGNLQLAYEGVGNFYTTANVGYEMVPGFTVRPEVSYRRWKDTHSELYNKEALAGALRVQRSF